MQDLSDDERKQVLGEVIFGKFQAIREMLGDIPRRDEFNRLEEKVDTIAGDVETIKLVVKDHSTQLQRHEADIAMLKAAW